VLRDGEDLAQACHIWEFRRGSDGTSDVTRWRVTAPADPARLLWREEENSLRQWVLDLLLTRVFEGNLNKK
jgi:hypothetical protein